LLLLLLLFMEKERERERAQRQSCVCWFVTAVLLAWAPGRGRRLNFLRFRWAGVLCSCFLSRAFREVGRCRYSACVVSAW